MASTSAEAGASEFDSSYFPRPVRHATTTRKLYCAPSTACSVWISSSQKQPAEGRAAMREPDRIVRLKTVLARTGLSRSTIYRKTVEGTFPPQIKISINGSGWRESDIVRWIADPLSWRPKSQFDEDC
jgi:prophage regulatory protein